MTLYCDTLDNSFINFLIGVGIMKDTLLIIILMIFGGTAYYLFNEKINNFLLCLIVFIIGFSVTEIDKRVSKSRRK